MVDFAEALTTAQREALNRTVVEYDAPFARAVSFASLADRAVLAPFREEPDVRMGFGKLNAAAFSYLRQRES